MDLPASLPAVAARWLDDLLGPQADGTWEEPASTCGSCARCPAPVGPEAAPDPPFRPDLKCCMTVPVLANYLVGGALLDPDPAMEPGRQSVRRRIDARFGCGPLGLSVAPQLALHHSEARKAGDWGRVPALVCPHFEAAGGGTCGIWRHREAVCTTWFCQVERGAVGQAVWIALRRLLGCLEAAVARECARRLGIDGARPGWGAWLGRVEDYYRACAQAADAIDGRAARRIAGSEASFLTRELKAALAARDDDSLPTRLTVGTWEERPARPGTRRLRSWSPWDAVEIDADKLLVLQRFDGRPVAEVLAALPAAARPDDETLRSWIDHRLLTDPDARRPDDPLRD